MPRVFSSSAVLALSTTLALALCSIASGASALDCDQRLVSIGDHAVQVRQACGEPAAISTRIETRTRFAGEARGDAFGGASFSVSVAIEVWVYDFGPRRFMEELTFENGILRHTRRLGYGTRARRERAARAGTGASSDQRSSGFRLVASAAIASSSLGVS